MKRPVQPDLPPRRETSSEPRHRAGHSHAGLEIVKGIGILGDSLSDEYRFYAPDRVTARNWVEILSLTRGFHFGAPTESATRGTPKNRPFGFNWSRSGATTTSLIASGQHLGLEAQIRGGEPISLAAMTIGTNDFADVLLTTRSVEAMRTVLEKATSNLAAILDHLLRITPTLKLAVFTAVDLLPAPILRGAFEVGLISPSLAAAYQSAIATFNTHLYQLIFRHRHRIAVVDINQLLNTVVTARTYVVGGLELDWITPGNDARHLFLSDGFHPGTIGQCLIATQFLTAINTAFGTAIPALDDQEILRIAASVRKPSVSSLIGTGLLAAVFGYGRRRPRAA
jgi:phospholipase/lecithinase/hemolysin